jgi:hypothetical protein
MPTSNEDPSQVADALNRLSAAMEQLQVRYDATERTNRRVRIGLIVVLVILGGAVYRALSPIADQLSTLPQIISQALPGFKTESLDPETSAAERQRLMDALSPEERDRIETFEAQQQWVSDYIAVTEGFDPGASIALFLSNMARSVEVIPDLYAEVRAMNDEMRTMNGKMSSIPVLAAEIQGMHAQMSALPVLATDVKGMHFYMSIMARDLDSTMGEAGRMMPWNW